MPIKAKLPTLTLKRSTTHQEGLHAAAAGGNPTLLARALRKGEPVDSILHGVTALHAASSCGDEACVKLLLAHGADVNAARLCLETSSSHSQELLSTPSRYADFPGAPGSTPLHFAAANGHLAVTQILLSYGARPALYDQAMLSPELLASANGHHEVVLLLRSWPHSGERTLSTSETRRTHHPAYDLPSPAALPSASASPPPSPSRLRPQASLEQLAGGVKARLRSTKDAVLRRRSSQTDMSKIRFLSDSLPQSLELSGFLSAAHPSSETDSLAAAAEGSANTTPRASLNPSSLDLGRMTSSHPWLDSSAAESPDLGQPANPQPARVTKRRPSLPLLVGRAGHSPSSLRSNLPQTDAISHSKDNVTKPASKRRPSLPLKVHLLATAASGSHPTAKRSLSTLLRKAVVPGQGTASPLPQSTPTWTRSLSSGEIITRINTGAGEDSEAMHGHSSFPHRNERQSYDVAPEVRVGQSHIAVLSPSQGEADINAGSPGKRDRQALTEVDMTAPSTSSGKSESADGAGSSDDPQEYIGDTPLRLDSSMRDGSFAPSQWRSYRPAVSVDAFRVRKTTGLSNNLNDSSCRSSVTISTSESSSSRSPTTHQSSSISHSSSNQSRPMPLLRSPHNATSAIAKAAPDGHRAQSQGHRPQPHLSSSLGEVRHLASLRDRSDSWASTASAPALRNAERRVQTRSNSSLRVTYNTSEQAVGVLLRHAEQFAQGKVVRTDDGSVLTLAGQLAAYGDVLERESQGLRTPASTPGSATVPIATTSHKPLPYRPSKEQLSSLPVVDEDHHKLDHDRVGLSTGCGPRTDVESVSPKSGPAPLAAGPSERDGPSSTRRNELSLRKSDEQLSSRRIWTRGDDANRSSVSVQSQVRSNRPQAPTAHIADVPGAECSIERKRHDPQECFSSPGPMSDPNEGLRASPLHSRHVSSVQPEMASQGGASRNVSPPARTARALTSSASAARGRSASDVTRGSVMLGMPGTPSSATQALQTPLTTPSLTSLSSMASPLQPAGCHLTTSELPPPSPLHLPDEHAESKVFYSGTRTQKFKRPRGSHRHSPSTPTELPSWKDLSHSEWSDAERLVHTDARPPLRVHASEVDLRSRFGLATTCDGEHEGRRHSEARSSHSVHQRSPENAALSKHSASKYEDDHKVTSTVAQSSSPDAAARSVPSSSLTSGNRPGGLFNVPPAHSTAHAQRPWLATLDKPLPPLEVFEPPMAVDLQHQRSRQKEKSLATVGHASSDRQRRSSALKHLVALSAPRSEDVSGSTRWSDRRPSIPMPAQTESAQVEHRRTPFKLSRGGRENSKSLSSNIPPSPTTLASMLTSTSRQPLANPVIATQQQRVSAGHATETAGEGVSPSSVVSGRRGWKVRDLLLGKR